jgi:uroporphyrinogen III methyltransferase / synthase
MSAGVGRVYLVGAGPGDPGLLTVRAERCLAAADVVVHDYLVGPRLLEGVRPDAEVVAVGRSHDDPARLGQTDIEALLIDRARAGRVVVRLKNGDPFLFGRGGEEAEALARAGIPCEIVPGVPSALAVPAYAGIPLTHRDHASVVTIVTGHRACAGADDAVASLPWDALIGRGGTLVFLMGMRQLPAIMAALAAHGMAPDTPAAVVSWGTTGGQRTVTGTLESLGERAAAAGLHAPGTIVVGSVVTLRERIAWFERRPLFGRRVVVTRPRPQAAAFASLLEAAGAEAIVFPTVALAPAPDPRALAAAVAGAAAYDWILFTSANGVRVFFDRFAADGRDVRELAPVRFGVIGPETAAELERRLVRPAVCPVDFRAEGLLDVLADEDVSGRRVLLPRAAGARSILPETLRRRGARVDEVVAYRAIRPPEADARGLRAALETGAIDALTFTSSSTVRNFAELVGTAELERLVRNGRPAVACIGPVTADTARELGLAVTVMPREYTVAALTAALATHFCNAGADPLCPEEG